MAIFALCAVAKVRDLEAKYPQFISRINTKESAITVAQNTKSTLTTANLAALDLSTVLKVSQAISEEIVLEKLLEKLMQFVLENAGAQAGWLFLHKSDKLILAAHGYTEPEVVVQHFQAGEESLDLPTSLINYVARTKDVLVLNDATQEGLFTNDPYIVKYQPKSVLVLPIIYQGKLTGILYLENRTTKSAFENASLYKDLQSYSQELEQKNQALQQSEAREREKASELAAALHSLQNTQLQLIQSEKLSSLGQMVAGIAHEINNPVNFINVNLAHASNYTQDLLNLVNLYQQHYPQPVKDIEDEIEAIDLEFLQEDMPKMLGSLKLGCDRIMEIIRSLRNFSRQDAQDLTLHDIHEGIDTTLMILQHRLKAQPHRPAIEIIKEYGDLPMVSCYAGLLNQVFMNLLANAIDAIEESLVTRSLVKDKGLIQIRTFLNLDKTSVVILIRDNGMGMSPEVQQKVFDYLYTTKSVGKGTGIGLSISRQIVVEKHHGQLSCNSAPGEGAEFAIALPVL
ncbi:ATP-binding protein [Iningainema tapete]|uniref:ATP-binding protein n=1 Tax=Iningainema tapete TaxID=2806730 RepID=UPI003080D04E